MKRLIILGILFTLCAGASVSAHSGNTDSKGGHWDHSNGTYHYHTPKDRGYLNQTIGLEEAMRIISEELSPSERHAIEEVKFDNDQELYQFVNRYWIALENRAETARQETNGKWIRGIGILLIIFCIYKAIRSYQNEKG